MGGHAILIAYKDKIPKSTIIDRRKTSIATELFISKLETFVHNPWSLKKAISVDIKTYEMYESRKTFNI